MTTLDAAEGDMLMHVRSAALPALEQVGQWLLDDVAVPVPQIPALLKAYADIGRKHRSWRCCMASSESSTLGTF